MTVVRQLQCLATWTSLSLQGCSGYDVPLHVWLQSEYWWRWQCLSNLTPKVLCYHSLHACSLSLVTPTLNIVRGNCANLWLAGVEIMGQHLGGWWPHLLKLKTKCFICSDACVLISLHLQSIVEKSQRREFLFLPGVVVCLNNELLELHLLLQSSSLPCRMYTYTYT